MILPGLDRVVPRPAWPVIAWRGPTVGSANVSTAAPLPHARRRGIPVRIVPRFERVVARPARLVIASRGPGNPGLFARGPAIGRANAPQPHACRRGIPVRVTA